MQQQTEMKKSFSYMSCQIQALSFIMHFTGYLLGITARYPRLHLLISYDGLLKNQERSHEENILKEASKTSGLATMHLRETLFSLLNASTIRSAKTLQGNDSH